VTNEKLPVHVSPVIFHFALFICHFSFSVCAPIRGSRDRTPIPAVSESGGGVFRISPAQLAGALPGVRLTTILSDYVTSDRNVVGCRLD
jgi:hypothetical protein